MSKQKIWWHEECLANNIAHNARQKKLLTRALQDLDRSDTHLGFYLSQIEEAKRRGMDAFDRDRLLKKRPIRAEGAMISCGETED